jgi:hypothetical protein
VNDEFGQRDANIGTGRRNTEECEQQEWEDEERLAHTCFYDPPASGGAGHCSLQGARERNEQEQ